MRFVSRFPFLSIRFKTHRTSQAWRWASSSIFKPLAVRLAGLNKLARANVQALTAGHNAQLPHLWASCVVSRGKSPGEPALDVLPANERLAPHSDGSGRPRRPAAGVYKLF